MIDSAKISHMDFPAYASQWEKLQTLRADLTAIEADISAGLAAMVPHPESDRVTARRAKLLGDNVATAAEDALDRGRISALIERKRDLIAVIEEQVRRVDAVRGPIDAEICERVKPEHDQLARAVCEALIVLQGHMKTYGAFVDRLNSAGVAWSGRFRPAQIRALGDPTDKHSRLGLYLDDMAKYGILDQQEIPKELRHERAPAAAPVAQKPSKRAPRLVNELDWSEVA